MVMNLKNLIYRSIKLDKILYFNLLFYTIIFFNLKFTTKTSIYISSLSVLLLIVIAMNALNLIIKSLILVNKEKYDYYKTKRLLKLELALLLDLIIFMIIKKQQGPDHQWQYMIHHHL